MRIMRGLMKVCKAFSSRLSGKLSIEISVAADPNPNPGVIWESLRHGAVVTRNADRPKARVSADALKLE